MRCVAVVLGALATLQLGAVPGAKAQQQPAAQAEPAHKRPRLRAGADTNDALAYYNLGVTTIDRRPRQGADAVYWAARLSPQNPEPLYGRWAALHLGDPKRLERYVQHRSGHGIRNTHTEYAIRDTRRSFAIRDSQFFFRRPCPSPSSSRPSRIPIRTVRTRST